jgi:hypothetical protein
MTRVIVYRRPDGATAIVNPAQDDDEFLALVMAKDVPPDATDVRIAQQSDVPVDRTFRNALKTDMQHDMPKAREIQRDRMRRARAPKLEALDAEFMRALEAGAPTADIVARKQALRDVTADPRIENAQSTAALKAVWPSILD